MEEQDKKHYACEGGCRGASREPGTCTTGDCSNKDVEMRECGCGDDSHPDSQNSTNG